MLGITVLTLGALAVAAATVVRRQTILLRGEMLLAFTITGVAITGLEALLRRSFPWLVLLLALVALLAAYRYRRTWWLLNNNAERTATTVGRCLATILVPAEQTPEGYRCRLRESIFTIRLFHRGGLGAILLADAPPSRKVQILRRLLKKSFPGVLPTLTIKLRT